MIRIREAKMRDVPEILKIWKEFMKYHDEIVIKKDQRFREFVKKKENAPALFRKYVTKDIRSPKAKIILAHVNNELVGYSIALISEDIPLFRTGKIGCIADIFVRKEFHGKGISSLLKEHAFRWFKEKGVKYVSVSVLGANEHAHEVYKKWGFFDYKIELRREI